MDDQEWSRLSYSKKDHQLFLSQKKVLHKFRDRSAISAEQDEKSLQNLTVKMREVWTAYLQNRGPIVGFYQ